MKRSKNANGSSPLPVPSGSTKELRPQQDCPGSSPDMTGSDTVDNALVLGHSFLTCRMMENIMQTSRHCGKQEMNFFN